MTLATPAQTTTWTYVDGDWHEGNVAILGPRTPCHVAWLQRLRRRALVRRRGARPRPPCERVNASAIALGLKPTMATEEIVGLTWDGLKKFDGKTAVYIRPMYWAEHGGYMGVPADPASTRFCLCLYESPMIPPAGFSITVSPFRRPTLETMPTDAKAGCLYPNNGRAILEAQDARLRQCAGARHAGQCRRDRLVQHLHGQGRACLRRRRRTARSCPASPGRAPSRCSADYGFQTARRRSAMRDFLEADEIFSTGNHSKIVPVTRIEDRDLQPGPVAKKARELYWEWAHSTPAG